MFNRLIALAAAIWFNLKYISRLRITPKEIVRYFLKSMNLAVCYSGFSMPGNIGQAFRAGKSAFLCCAYDVITDWRQFNSFTLEVGRKIIASETDADIARIAIDLYEKDASGLLADDGLERGSLALRFVTRLIGSEDFYANKMDIDHAGRLWQLVDDLLDYEADLQAGDLNCLGSSNRHRYLEQAEALLREPFASTFLQDRVLAQVARRAVEKARNIAQLDFACEKNPDRKAEVSFLPAHGQDSR